MHEDDEPEPCQHTKGVHASGNVPSGRRTAGRIIWKRREFGKNKEAIEVEIDACKDRQCYGERQEEMMNASPKIRFER